MEGGQAVFDFLKKKKKERPAPSALWEETDGNRFVTALSARVAEKCAYGDDLAALSPVERVFYLTQTCEEEVNNGGFDQLFYNAGFDLRELPEAFRAIGAPRTGDICARALAALGGEVPEDLEARREVLASREGAELTETLRACDEAFLRYEEDLEARNAAYVRAHREDFT